MMQSAKSRPTLSNKRTGLGHVLLTAIIVPVSVFVAGEVLAQKIAETNRPLSGLGSGKDPIKIDADRLDIFDQEKRAVFSGNVVAVQGDTVMRCSSLNVFYEQSATGKEIAAPAESRNAETNNNIRRLDCKGPVTVVSKEQTATGEHAVFDRDAHTVTLTGKVALSQGQNIQQCDRVIYNMETSVASCIARPGGRVQGVFAPGSVDPIR